jgi:hypothetical protein
MLHLSLTWPADLRTVLKPASVIQRHGGAVRNKSPGGANIENLEDMRVSTLETVALGLLLVGLYMGIIWFMHLLHKL